MKTTETNIITALEAHIAENCTTVDREERFNAILDECYSFEKVGGPFANMSPSRVLLEVDPVAHRCGVNDFGDSEGWVEVNGETYEQDEAEEAKEGFLDGIRSELEDLETELHDAEMEDDPDAEEITRIKSEIAAKEAGIATLEKHSF